MSESRYEPTKEIDAAKFQEQCLDVLDQLDAEGLIITKHGQPIARVFPFVSQDADLIGSLRHKIKVNGDLLSTGLDWGAAAQP